LLPDVVARLSDIELGIVGSMNPAPVGIGHHDAGSVGNNQITDDDDDDDDDSAFTHSSALTIKSWRHSPDSSFDNVGSSSSCGQVSESSATPNRAAELLCAEDSAVAPSITSRSNNVNDSPLNLRQSPQCTGSQDVSGVTCTNDADSDLQSFLSELGLGKYADIFREQDVDLPMFLTLNEDDLKEIGIRLQCTHDKSF